GRFEAKGDVDHYVFSARKGQRLVLRGHTHEGGSPAEVHMALKNPGGTQLAGTNPAAHPGIGFTPAADGDGILSLEQLNYLGRADQTYRLTIAPYEPGFELTLGLDRYDLAPGGYAAVPIQTVVRRDFGGPIEVSVTGTPAITGRTVIQGPPHAPNQPAGL